MQRLRRCKVSICIGIDPSYTGCGVIVLETDTGDVKEKLLIKTPAKEEYKDRVRMIWNKVSSFFDAPVEVVAIEGLAFSRTNQAHQMGYLHYRLREYIQAHKSNPSLIVPATTQLKKFVTGKGNAPKDTMMMQVYKHWGVEIPNNNICDAYGLAQIGRAYVGAEAKLLKHQQEVVAALKG